MMELILNTINVIVVLILIISYIGIFNEQYVKKYEFAWHIMQIICVSLMIIERVISFYLDKLSPERVLLSIMILPIVIYINYQDTLKYFKERKTKNGGKNTI